MKTAYSRILAGLTGATLVLCSGCFSGVDSELESQWQNAQKSGDLTTQRTVLNQLVNQDQKRFGEQLQQVEQAWTLLQQADNAAKDQRWDSAFLAAQMSYRQVYNQQAKQLMKESAKHLKPSRKAAELVSTEVQIAMSENARQEISVLQDKAVNTWNLISLIENLKVLHKQQQHLDDVIAGLLAAESIVSAEDLQSLYQQRELIVVSGRNLAIAALQASTPELLRANDELGASVDDLLTVPHLNIQKAITPELNRLRPQLQEFYEVMQQMSLSGMSFPEQIDASQQKDVVDEWITLYSDILWPEDNLARYNRQTSSRRNRLKSLLALEASDIKSGQQIQSWSTVMPEKAWQFLLALHTSETMLYGG